jgi:hypothetical protein
MHVRNFETYRGQKELLRSNQHLVLDRTEINWLRRLKGDQEVATLQMPREIKSTKKEVIIDNV